MPYTSDTSTVLGMLRVLIGDRVIVDPDRAEDDSAHFLDADLEVFLALEANDIRLAAAAALDSWAAELSHTAHKVTIGDYTEDTSVTAKALRERATDLRTQASESPAFAIAEVGWDGPLGFPGRDILLNAALRGEI